LPKQVEFFKNANLKVTDVHCGKHYTIAVTENGAVYSWGFGGFSDYKFLDYICARTGALGLGNKENLDSPTEIQSLKNQPKLKKISLLEIIS